MNGPTIGVDLGGTQLRAALVDADGTIVRRIDESTSREGRKPLLDQIVGAVSALKTSETAGACVAVPGPVNTSDGLISEGINVPLRGLPLAALVENRVALPTAVDRDANAALIGEMRYGAGRGLRHVLMLTLGTGVGGSAMVDGALVRGAAGAGGELGHVTLNGDGRPCLGVCRGRGHLEAYASGSAIATDAERVARERPNGGLGRRSAAAGSIDTRDVVELATEGDVDARAILDEAGRFLGFAIEGLANVFNPELVIIGGSVAAAGELLLGPARHVIEERLMGPAALVRITVAHLGGDAGS